MIAESDRRRLSTTAGRVRTLVDELVAERTRRNRIVRHYIERGETYRAVARAVGLSVAQVAAIMARPEPVEL